jgi:4'-phosphopantetheinyl transferase
LDILARQSPGDEVDVWLASLEAPMGPARGLPPQERERAASFLRPRDAERWVASRRALRHVLSTYLDRDPADIEIVLGENGKPRLPDGGPEFNLSHSGELALVAVSPARPVGVDVERIEPARDLLALAERALGEEEAISVRAASRDERAAVFYAAWVRHEARLKCLGVGLDVPAPQVPVTVENVDVPAGYAAAVAVSRPSRSASAAGIRIRRRSAPGGNR